MSTNSPTSIRSRVKSSKKSRVASPEKKALKMGMVSSLVKDQDTKPKIPDLIKKPASQKSVQDGSLPQKTSRKITLNIDNSGNGSRLSYTSDLPVIHNRHPNTLRHRKYWYNKSMHVSRNKS